MYVITKPLKERNKTELPQYTTIEKNLKEWGIIVIHKLRMHEKEIFIDDFILWTGSLNSLSFSDSGETMERRNNRKVFDDYVKTERLDELIGIIGTDGEKCPSCGSEIIAAEGAYDPYYWRCSNDECDYTRSIYQPPPRDGLLVCPTCSAPVKFGYWGKKPYWICTKNNRHRLKLFKSHLKLSKMLELIPHKERINLFKTLKLDKSVVEGKQMRLFE